MPSYDFVCADCGSRYEVRLSMSAYSAGEGRRCTGCGSANVERAFTAVNVLTGSASRRSTSAMASACGPGGFT